MRVQISHMVWSSGTWHLRILFNMSSASMMKVFCSLCVSVTGSIANFFLSGTGGDLMRLRDNIFFGAGTGTGWGLLHSFWCMRGFV